MPRFHRRDGTNYCLTTQNKTNTRIQKNKKLGQVHYIIDKLEVIISSTDIFWSNLSVYVSETVATTKTMLMAQQEAIVDMVVLCPDKLVVYRVISDPANSLC